MKFRIAVLLFFLCSVGMAPQAARAAEPGETTGADKKADQASKAKKDSASVDPARTTGTTGAKKGAGAQAGKAPAQSARALDRSGKKKKGKASYYSRRFNGKPMADGTPMNPQSNSAASRTLPLGTKARVTNLENGRSAEVEIRDRGPYVAGRTIDVTPKTAAELGFKEDGVAPVEVAPIEVPQPDGTEKKGEGARG